MAVLVFADEDVTLAGGRYAGELLADVADEDPSHLRRLLQLQINNAEREAIEAALDAVEE